MRTGPRFTCPPDCGLCCTNLHREVTPAQRRATAAFRAMMREEGVYGCQDRVATGLAIPSDEAAPLLTIAKARGLPRALHPRTWLLETRRRQAVVLDWHMPRVACVFYEAHRCTVHADRPLVCRAYPVLGARFHLATACPLTGPARADADAGRLRLATFLAPEARARGAVERANARLDERGARILSTPGARFVKGLSAAEARARLARYAVIHAHEWA